MFSKPASCVSRHLLLLLLTPKNAVHFFFDMTLCDCQFIFNNNNAFCCTCVDPRSVEVGEMTVWEAEVRVPSRFLVRAHLIVCNAELRV